MGKVVRKSNILPMLFEFDGTHDKQRFSLKEFRQQIHCCEVNAKAERFLCDEKAESYYLWIKDELETAYQELRKLSKPNKPQGRIDSFDIKARTDITELISTYVALKKSGRTFTGLCPFHAEKSPSFTVYPETQSWYCFSCNRGGDVIDFIMLADGTDFKGALTSIGRGMEWGD